MSLLGCHIMNDECGIWSVTKTPEQRKAAYWLCGWALPLSANALLGAMVGKLLPAPSHRTGCGIPGDSAGVSRSCL
jgi:predicted branched-subunit amino acid permease